MNDLKREGSLRGVNFERGPFLVIWEVTQACDLACVHCRAEAKPNRDPEELSTPEGFQLLEEIGRFGHPLFVFTGGDPLKREDIFDLITYAKGVGLRTGFSPSGTPLLTYENLKRAKEAGLDSLSISIDGSSAQTHDSFRQVLGSFHSCLRGARAARELGLDLQINTTVTRYNYQDLDKIADLVAQLEAKRWSVFFLVPTGRGREEDEVSPWEYERILHWLYDLSKEARFRIKTTEAQHYRRVVIQRLAQEEGLSPQAMLSQVKSGRGRFLPGINSGRGFLFISHVGDIYPSGFLPRAAGNVRQDSLVEIYRHSSLFRQLRDASRLKGRCGICEYRFVCRGSRARAYALTGDYLAEDPYCIYQPEGS